MQPEFWHERWANQQIGFHEPAPNPLLLRHFAALGLARGARLFLPLCGKTLDIDWLLSQGYRVVGAELSAIAAAEVFERMKRRPSMDTAGPLQRWHADALEIWVGDFFELEPHLLATVDAVYDRAALIAMPPRMRPGYATQLAALACGAPQLLITLEYDQDLLQGPPFCVGAEELPSLYPAYLATRLATEPVVGGLKGRCPATEQVWLLRTTPR